MEYPVYDTRLSAEENKRIKDEWLAANENQGKVVEFQSFTAISDELNRLRARVDALEGKETPVPAENAGEYPKMLYLHPEDKSQEHKYTVVENAEQEQAATGDGFVLEPHIPVPSTEPAPKFVAPPAPETPAAPEVQAEPVKLGEGTV